MSIKFVPGRYDRGEAKWTLLPTTIDNNAMTLTATTNRFSIWAVIVSGGGGAGVAQTTLSSQQSGVSTARATYAGVDVVMVAAALGLCVVVIGKKWLQ